jgi:Pup amidohydrolase
MVAPKFVGVETEYGIVVTGPVRVDPVTASALVVSAYRDLIGASTGFDHTDEHPERDARTAGRTPRERPDPVVVDGGAENTVLPNGARLYVDHAHPEYATPECASARDLVVWDRAGERILERAAAEATSRLPEGAEVLIHKNNTDGKGAAYGTHENYLVPRDVPFGLLTRHLLPFFVSRSVFVGSGHLGSLRDEAVGYQLSQRADFFEAEIGLETTVRRPLMNTRDEPHADPDRFRRLHVITGDANLCEVATFLKVGTMLLVLDAIESGMLGDPIELEDPVGAFRAISHDPSCTVTVRTTDGRRIAALDIQEHHLEACSLLVERDGHRSGSEEVLAWWRRVITALRTDPDDLDGVVDWVTKRRLLAAYAERHGLGPDDARLRLIDLQYHDLRAERGLHRRLEAAGRIERIVSDAEIERAIDHPPQDTRAWLRGECIRRFPDAVVAAGWDSVVLDVPGRGLVRLALEDPGQGTRERVGPLLDRAHDVRMLIDLLGPDGAST